MSSNPVHGEVYSKTTLYDKVCQWLAAGLWFSLGTPVSSTNFLICVCLCIVVSNTYCVVFLFVVCTLMLTVSLDCPFLTAPWVFFNVYFLKTERRIRNFSTTYLSWTNSFFHRRLVLKLLSAILLSVAVVAQCNPTLLFAQASLSQRYLNNFSK